jgi:hypothetical protein
MEEHMCKKKAIVLALVVALAMAWDQYILPGRQLPVTISVAAKYPPSKEALKFYRLVGKVVADAGCSLELEMPKSGTKMRF